ncbi:hypothetical protein LguiB_004697 [Lonicera macranthoides]
MPAESPDDRFVYFFTTPNVNNFTNGDFWIVENNGASFPVEDRDYDNQVIGYKKTVYYDDSDQDDIEDGEEVDPVFPLQVPYLDYVVCRLDRMTVYSNVGRRDGEEADPVFSSNEISIENRDTAAETAAAAATDPNQLQDFCVATDKNPVDCKGKPVFVNGLFCKDPMDVKAKDFFFSGLNIPGNTSNAVGSFVTPVTVFELPGLNTLGISSVRIDYAPKGLNPPHTHPRATEILTVIKGKLFVGFVTSNPDNRLFTKLLCEGDVFVFPMGLIHFQFNVGKTKAVALASLSSQNPGVITIANAIFGSNPLIKSKILEIAFQVDKKLVEKLQSQFWLDNWYYGKGDYGYGKVDYDCGKGKRDYDYNYGCDYRRDKGDYDCGQGKGDYDRGKDQRDDDSGKGKGDDGKGERDNDSGKGKADDGKGKGDDNSGKGKGDDNSGKGKGDDYKKGKGKGKGKGDDGKGKGYDDSVKGKGY